MKKKNTTVKTYVATSYNSLGIVYRHLGQYNEAKEYHGKALITRKKILGEEHPYRVTVRYRDLRSVDNYLRQCDQTRSNTILSMEFSEAQISY